MGKNVLLIIGFLVILAAITPTGVALAYEEGVISGQVLNKTKVGSAVKGLEVTLTTYINEQAASEQKVSADDTGKFEFKGLSRDASSTYLLTARFQEALYSSEMINLKTDDPLRKVELTVYDSTPSDENIQVSNGHIVAYVDQSGLQVMEIWRFNNSGDKTYIGTQGKTVRSTLKFTLPEGATAVYPGRGFIVEENDTGMVGTSSVPPGITDVSFSYIIPYQGSNLTISRKTDYEVASFGLLVQDTGAKVKSIALTEQIPLEMGGAKYLYFTAQNLSRGIDLDASFSGMTITRATILGTSNPWPWLAAGIAALGLVLLAAYPRLVRKRAMEYVTASILQPQQADRLADERNALIREIASLDDEFEAGKIIESEYRARRLSAKARLVEIYKYDKTLGKQ